MFSILDADSEQFEGQHIDVNKVRDIIEFKNVNFSYVPEKRVISDFTLKIESGKKIALVGSTGSGKTTIINLLMRFYEIDSGEILLDGQNIKDIALGDLRDSIGIVLQDTKLFSDTIRGNIAYAVQNPTQEELDRAAEFRYCDKIIKKLPDQYDTMLSQTSVSLSQGEQQLIAIGRAFLSYPQILILDEATSNVDTRTELNIQNAMNQLITGENDKLSVPSDVNEFGKAVRFHMERCDVTSDQLADRSGMGVNTVNKMRSGKKVKLETVLAFCVALELEESFRIDLMQKAKIEFDMSNPAHRLYVTIFELMEKPNVFQINELLKAEGFTPWTRDSEEKKRYAKKIM